MKIRLSIDKRFNEYFLLLILSKSIGVKIKKIGSITDELLKDNNPQITELEDFREYYRTLSVKDKQNIADNISSETNIVEVEKALAIVRPVLDELWVEEGELMEEQKSILEESYNVFVDKMDSAINDLIPLFQPFAPKVPDEVTVQLLCINSHPKQKGTDFGKSLTTKTIALALFDIEEDVLVKRVWLLILHEIIHSIFENENYKKYLKSLLKDCSEYQIQLVREAVVNLFAPRGIFASKYFDINDSIERSREKMDYSMVSLITSKTSALQPEIDSLIDNKNPIDDVFIRKIASIVVEAIGEENGSVTQLTKE